MQPLSGNLPPDLLTSLWTCHVSCTAPSTRHASLRILIKCPTPAIVSKMSRNPHILLTIDKVHNPLRVPLKTTAERQKVICARLFSFLHVWLRRVLRATAACTCWTSQRPKLLRTWGAFNMLTSKFASRHNSVQLFISHLPRWLRTRHFSEPTFRPGATFLPFRALGSSFFWLSLLWSSFFFSSLQDFPTSAFPSVHIVGSLTSKLLNVLR